MDSNLAVDGNFRTTMARFLAWAQETIALEQRLKT